MLVELELRILLRKEHKERNRPPTKADTAREKGDTCAQASRTAEHALRTRQKLLAAQLITMSSVSSSTRQLSDRACRSGSESLRCIEPRTSRLIPLPELPRIQLHGAEGEHTPKKDH